MDEVATFVDGIEGISQQRAQAVAQALKAGFSSRMELNDVPVSLLDQLQGLSIGEKNLIYQAAKTSSVWKQPSLLATGDRDFEGRTFRLQRLHQSGKGLQLSTEGTAAAIARKRQVTALHCVSSKQGDLFIGGQPAHVLEADQAHDIAIMQTALTIGHLLTIVFLVNGVILNDG